MSNRHDFKGIKKLSSDILRAFFVYQLSKIGLSWILDNKFSRIVFDFFVQKHANALANKGVFLVNIMEVNADVDSEEAKISESSKVIISELYDSQMNRKPITEKRKKEIDDEIIKRFRDFGVFIK